METTLAGRVSVPGLIPCRRCRFGIGAELDTCPRCGVRDPTLYRARSRLKRIGVLIGAVGLVDLTILLYWFIFHR